VPLFFIRRVGNDPIRKHSRPIRRCWHFWTWLPH
jgi:hypothetical protein